MSCTTTNDETTRTCTHCACACETPSNLWVNPVSRVTIVTCAACWDAQVEADERERERYDDREDAMQAGDDSDIDPPFDYSAPEDDSDRNGGSDDRKGYECPD
jgi:hypothetical protein